MGNICLNMDTRRQMDFHFKLYQANTESWSSESERLGFKVRTGFRLELELWLLRNVIYL